MKSLDAGVVPYSLLRLELNAPTPTDYDWLPHNNFALHLCRVHAVCSRGPMLMTTIH